MLPILSSCVALTLLSTLLLASAQTCPDILMVQSTEDGPWLDASCCMHRAHDRRVLCQR